MPHLRNERNSLSTNFGIGVRDLVVAPRKFELFGNDAVGDCFFWFTWEVFKTRCIVCAKGAMQS
jgi:hypothetical protein